MGLAVFGIYVVLAAAVIHRHESAGVPWGLLASIGLTWLVARGASAVMNLAVAWFGLGWALGLLALQAASGDDYLIASDWIGWTFTFGSLGVIIAAAVCAPRLEP